MIRACQQGLGIAALPDYLVEENKLVQLFGESDRIALDTYFVYPEESVARSPGVPRLRGQQGAALAVLSAACASAPHDRQADRRRSGDADQDEQHDRHAVRVGCFRRPAVTSILS
ncbi:MAG: hypothetical protein MZV49_24585 [Rhodopseudomonas palustris]|nr:hypothetical protein [Rhodopseudomonas palustris]